MKCTKMNRKMATINVSEENNPKRLMLWVMMFPLSGMSFPTPRSPC